MSEEPTTKEASITPDSSLEEMEQAINSEAGTEITTEETSEEKQGTEAPELGQAFAELAEKKGFKSAEDLAIAYREMESYSTRINQQMKDLSSKVERALPKQQTEDPFSNLPAEQREALDLLGRIIDQKISPLREDLEVRKAGQEIQSVKERFPGIDNTQIEDALSIVERSPGLELEEALKIVTYEAAKATSQQQQRKATTTQQKKRAFVETAKTSRAGGEIDYSSLSLEELESILPKDGQFVDHKGKLRR